MLFIDRNDYKKNSEYINMLIKYDQSEILEISTPITNQLWLDYISSYLHSNIWDRTLYEKIMAADKVSINPGDILHDYLFLDSSPTIYYDNDDEDNKQYYEEIYGDIFDEMDDDANDIEEEYFKYWHDHLY